MMRRLANFLAINRTIGVVLVSVLLFGLGEELWRSFLPLYLRDQSKTLAEQAGSDLGLSTASLWYVAFFAFGLNVFQGLCYVGGGQLTAQLGDRGSLFFFGLLTLAGYVLFLTIPFAGAVVLASLLILGWESLSMPVTFTTVGATLEKKKQGMAFAVQSIQKRLPKIIGPPIAGLVLTYFIVQHGGDVGRSLGMRVLVGCAMALGVVSLMVQWRWMPHRESVASGASAIEILRAFPLTIRWLLIAEIFTRWCDWLVREFVVLYVATERGLTDKQIGFLIGLQHIVALATYLPVGRMTQAVGLQPFVGLTFLFFALFPLTLILVPDGWIWLAFVVYGLREIGEPARKATITTQLPEAIRARGVGLYWGLRSFAVCWAPLVGAGLWLWGGPPLLFAAAFAFGALGMAIYYACYPREGKGQLPV
jgi:MFS family permease